eukprot:NODE_7365_length_1585_cov_8.879287.p1 GENE.NODE_7365_length_1585_cov_8.879287~~NODE_7365_length_1585_cov_8.879287.p1  ORF type:complete len:258 (+),score=80.17 NODE_7365_length_1585_cov_8.879287:692-1465(+)
MKVQFFVSEIERLSASLARFARCSSTGKAALRTELEAAQQYADEIEKSNAALEQEHHEMKRVFNAREFTSSTNAAQKDKHALLSELATCASTERQLGHELDQRSAVVRELEKRLEHSFAAADTLTSELRESMRQLAGERGRSDQRSEEMVKEYEEELRTMDAQLAAQLHERARLEHLCNATEGKLRSHNQALLTAATPTVLQQEAEPATPKRADNAAAPAMRFSPRVTPGSGGSSGRGGGGGSTSAVRMGSYEDDGR